MIAMPLLVPKDEVSTAEVKYRRGTIDGITNYGFGGESI
jgi:hypothetical protein